MAQALHADTAVSLPDTSRPDAPFRGLRSFEQSWRRLEAAATRGDALELAAASASAARACLADGDLDEARWHIERGRRVLDLHDTCPRGLSLQCELAELMLQIAAQVASDDLHAARRLRDDTRDVLFEVVRRARMVQDRSAWKAALLHVAELLVSLGDHSDAQTVRLQALREPGATLPR